MAPGGIAEAAAFAAEAHGLQKRKKTGLPYIQHPLRVGAALEAAGCPGAVVVAGILHDVVEDTHVTLAEIAEAFGDEVAALVAEVTDDGTLAAVARKRRQTELMRQKSPGAQMIKLADMADNMADLGDGGAMGSVAREVGYGCWKLQAARIGRAASPALWERACVRFRALGIDPEMPDEELASRVNSYFDLLENKD